MIVIWNVFLGNFKGITIFPFIILKDKKTKDNKVVINHEKIHIEQQKELLVIPFFIWYFVEWFIRLFMDGNAYRNISFEREAYANEDNVDYLKERRPFAFFKYMFNKN